MTAYYILARRAAYLALNGESLERALQTVIQEVILTLHMENREYRLKAEAEKRKEPTA